MKHTTNLKLMVLQKEHVQFAMGLLITGIPRWKAKAMLSQSLFESGAYNTAKKDSIYVQSGFTNSIGMRAPSNPKRYVENGGNVSGTFTSLGGGKWAKYNDLTRCAMDRVHWDKIMVDQKIDNLDAYLDALMARGYWVENGVDKGYRKKIANKIATADNYNEATLRSAESELKKKGYKMEDKKTNYMLYVGIAVAAWVLLKTTKAPIRRRYATYRRRRTTYNKLRM